MNAVTARPRLVTEPQLHAVAAELALQTIRAVAVSAIRPYSRTSPLRPPDDAATTLLSL